MATTNAKDLRESLPSTNDVNAARIIGELIAERSKGEDVYAIVYEPKKGEKNTLKLAALLETIVDNGIILLS